MGSSIDARRRGFTLLEILFTIVIVGVPVVMMLLIRERATRQSMQAYHYNVARMLARELLTELEFHELDRYEGPFDGFPGFSYQIEVEDVDLVTGEGEKEGDEDSEAAYTPVDAIDPEEGTEQLDYPVRRVKLTLRYPNLRDPDAKEPLELRIQTILPPLPKEDESALPSNPFGG